MPKTKIGKQIREELGILTPETPLKELDPTKFSLFGVQERPDGKFLFVEVKLKDHKVEAVVKSKLLTKSEALYMFKIETAKKVLK